MIKLLKDEPHVTLAANDSSMFMQPPTHSYGMQCKLSITVESESRIDELGSAKECDDRSEQTSTECTSLPGNASDLRISPWISSEREGGSTIYWTRSGALSKCSLTGPCYQKRAIYVEFRCRTSDRSNQTNFTVPDRRSGQVTSN